MSERDDFPERIKRVAKDVLQYQVTIDDPKTYERPWTMSFPLTPLDGNRILPYTCHEGNMALTQSLGGERAEDRALAEDLKKGIVRPRRPVQDGLGVGGQPAGPGGGLGIPGLGGGGREFYVKTARSRAQTKTLDRDLLKTFAEADHDAFNAAVAHQNVGARAKR